MKLSDVKTKIDSYFNTISPMVLLDKLKKYGLEITDEESPVSLKYVLIINRKNILSTGKILDCYLEVTYLKQTHTCNFTFPEPDLKLMLKANISPRILASEMLRELLFNVNIPASDLLKMSGDFENFVDELSTKINIIIK